MNPELIKLSNLAGLEEILRASDVNDCNEQGQCFVHVASGMGQLDVLKFLHVKGADLFRLDSNNESGVHWAARQGHEQIIDYLRHQGVSLSACNKTGETPLHLAAKQGHVKVIKYLCKHSCDVSLGNEECETALHLASVKGHLDSVRCLLDAGSDPDLVDKHGCTPLHLALRKQHTSIAIALLQNGCKIDTTDQMGEAPIHIASREGLLGVAQTLCAFGCKVEIQNKMGLYPLHLAAKNGHTELVRCLCLAGCDVELKNKDGIAAEITALAQGYNDIGDLLNRLRNVHLREQYISQLIPSTQPIGKIKLKLFGHSGVGKSTFVETLKCGYFSSWFRRSVGSMSPKTTKNKKDDQSNKSSIELNSSGPEKPKLHFETQYDTYTHGVDVQQVNISGIGDVSIWEFSGHEPYFMAYDNLIGNTNCMHLVFFRLCDPYEVQLQQVFYWLSFLRARIPPQEPLGYCGKSGKAGRVGLVATHADVACCHRVAATGEYVSSEASSILRMARVRFGSVFDMHETTFVMDGHVVGSPPIKALKCYVADNRQKVTQGLPKSTEFLEAVCAELLTWRKTKASFPAMTWKEFMESVHAEVNPLAGDEHMKELIQQLQIMGEVIYVACDHEDFVILDPLWLCTSVIGHLLSQETLDRSRVTGIYSLDDVQLMFPDTDANSLLPILEGLQLCTEGETEGEVEYEFPCFNMMETLEGLWSPSPTQYEVYAGSRFCCQQNNMLASIFPRLQVHLRRSAKEHSDPDSDLYQWYHGSKYCSGALEGLITLDDVGTSYEVKVRGPASMRTETFYFHEDLINMMEQMFADVCPGLVVERHVLSSSQLKEHAEKVASYSPVEVMDVLLKDGIHGMLTNPETGGKESIFDLLFLGSSEIILYQNKQFLVQQSTSSDLQHRQLPQSTTLPQHKSFHPKKPTSNSFPRSRSHSSSIISEDNCNPCSSFQRNQLGNTILLQDLTQNLPVVVISDLHASHMSLLSYQSLCANLDSPESMGKDWCMLGVLLGMTDKLPKLDPGDNPAFSPTSCILSEWIRCQESTIGVLLGKLEELERSDAVEMLISTLPFFRIVPFKSETCCEENDAEQQKSSPEIES